MDVVPGSIARPEAVADLLSFFDAPDRPESERRLGATVERYRTSAPKLSDWAEDQGGGTIPNDASPLRLVSGLLMEVSEDWETNRK